MRKAALTVALLAAASLPLAPAARAASLDQQDKTFVDEAARGGLAEVEAGKLAQKKAESPAVKQFGETMVRDHQQVNQKLMDVAKGLGVEAPTKPSDREQAQMQKLEGLSGAKFDQAYMRQQIEDHQKTIEAFQREAKDGKSQELRSLAEQTVPVLQRHLRDARQVGSEVGVRG